MRRRHDRRAQWWPLRTPNMTSKRDTLFTHCQLRRRQSLPPEFAGDLQRLALCVERPLAAQQTYRSRRGLHKRCVSCPLIAAVRSASEEGVSLILARVPQGFYWRTSACKPPTFGGRRASRGDLVRKVCSAAGASSRCLRAGIAENHAHKLIV